MGKAGGGRRYWNRKGHGSRLLELYYETFHAQSQPISSRAYLLQGMEELKQRYPDKDTVPLPDSLQGVYLYPTEIDVWHGSPDDRLHDRRLFTRTATGWSFGTRVPRGATGCRGVRLTPPGGLHGGGAQEPGTDAGADQRGFDGLGQVVGRPGPERLDKVPLLQLHPGQHHNRDVAQVRVWFGS